MVLFILQGTKTTFVKVGSPPLPLLARIGRRLPALQEEESVRERGYTVKKVYWFSRPHAADVINQTLSGRE
jgi:hypothetical protein